MAMPSHYMKATLIIETPMKPRFYNVFWYKPEVDTNPEDPQVFTNAAASAAAASIMGGLAACLTTVTRPVGVYVEMHIAGVVYTAFATDGTVAGTVAGDNCADWVAICIQKRTPFAGKSGRGRWFLGPVPEAFEDENRLEDTGRVAVETLVENWNTGLDVDGTSFLPQLHSAKNQTLTHITSVNVTTKLASMRGRKSATLV